MHRRSFIASGLAALTAHSFMGTSAVGQSASEASLKRRKRFLDELLQILPRTTSSQMTGRMNAHDKTWEDWLRRTGELPPDFDLMPSESLLQNPLSCLYDGSHAPITRIDQWQKQCDWMRAQFEHWIYGAMPPRPSQFRAVVTATRREGNVTVRDVRTEFGEQDAASLHLKLFIPDGAGPFPVVLTNQLSSNDWGDIALKRGYLACFYYATDPKYGYPDDSDKFIDVYPDYDFACIARWAWAAMRALDYLCSIPEVDRSKIAIYGHSRNSKQALLAAAFDHRIGAVAASSGTVRRVA